MPSNHLILLAPSPPTFNLSQHQGLFQWVSSCIRWPKYWSFSFSISPSNEYSGLVSFRIDWFDLTVQGTLKSLLQHRSSKASILRCSAFFIVQLSHLYMTSGKTIALTIRTFVGKVTPLLSNTLSRFTIAFLPRSKWLLISWLQSPSARLFWWLRQWRICLRMQEVRVWSLGQGMATHCSILAWGRLWTEEPGKATVHGATKSQTWLSS